MTDNTKEVVGYRMPPKKHQFVPGKSGNPKGRPRGRRSTYSVLGELLNQKVVSTQNGRTVKIDKRTLILTQAVHGAAKGNIKAIQNIIPHMLAIDEQNDKLAETKASLSINDEHIMQSLKERILSGKDKEVIDV